MKQLITFTTFSAVIILYSCSAKKVHLQKNNVNTKATRSVFSIVNTATQIEDSTSFFKDLIFEMAFASIKFVYIENDNYVVMQIESSMLSDTTEIIDTQKVADNNNLQFCIISKQTNQMLAVKDNGDTVLYNTVKPKVAKRKTAKWYNFQKLTEHEFLIDDTTRFKLFTSPNIPKKVTAGLQLNLPNGVYQYNAGKDIALRLQEVTTIDTVLSCSNFFNRRCVGAYSLIDTLARNTKGFDVDLK
jgi:hypothetical protein